MDFIEMLIPIFVDTILPAGGILVTGLVSWGLIRLNKYIKTKTGNEIVNNAMAHITHTVNTTVRELEQTLVPEIKKSLKDGKLTSVEAGKLRDIAIAKVKAQLPKNVEKAAYGAVNSLTSIIGAKIEGAVLDLTRGKYFK